MGGPLAETSFDYVGLPATEAVTLRAQASRIRKLNKTVMTTIIEVGIELIAIKKNLPKRFQDWVAAECGFSISTAENYMKAARLAEGRIPTVAILEPRTAYLLGSKSTPPQIVADAIADAAAGKPVTFDKVQEKITDVKDALREDKLKQLKAERDRRMSKQTRKKRAEAKAHWEAERRREQERAIELASEILQRLGEENTRYLAQIFDEDPTVAWSVFEDLKSRLLPQERAA